jgi:hypothetical protein
MNLVKIHVNRLFISRKFPEMIVMSILHTLINKSLSPLCIFRPTLSCNYKRAIISFSILFNFNYTIWVEPSEVCTNRC